MYTNRELLVAELDAIREAGLYKAEAALDSPQSAHIKVDGQNGPAITGEQAGKVKGQRRLAHPALLSGQYNSHAV